MSPHPSILWPSCKQSVWGLVLGRGDRGFWGARRLGTRLGDAAAAPEDKSGVPLTGAGRGHPAPPHNESPEVTSPCTTQRHLQGRCRVPRGLPSPILWPGLLKGPRSGHTLTLDPCFLGSPPRPSRELLAILWDHDVGSICSSCHPQAPSSPAGSARSCSVVLGSGAGVRSVASRVMVGQAAGRGHSVGDEASLLRW